MFHFTPPAVVTDPAEITAVVVGIAKVESDEANTKAEVVDAAVAVKAEACTGDARGVVV